MNTINENSSKRKYCAPQMEQVKLDNEISLALESLPPIGPGWEALNTQESMEPLILE